jgi:hypothetical protein
LVFSVAVTNAYNEAFKRRTDLFRLRVSEVSMVSGEAKHHGGRAWWSPVVHLIIAKSQKERQEGASILLQVLF